MIHDSHLTPPFHVNQLTVIQKIAKNAAYAIDFSGLPTKGQVEDMFCGDFPGFHLRPVSMV